MIKFDAYIRLLATHNPFSTTLGLVRSLLALSTLLTLLFNDCDLIFSTPNSTQICTQRIKELSIYCLFGEHNFFVPKIISTFILVLVIIGIYPRITGVLHWWVSVSFFISTPYVDGGDQVASILTFLLIPVTLLDSRKFHWIKNTSYKPSKNLVANFILKIIRIQVSVIYLHAVIAKFNMAEWIDGTVIYYWFTHNTFGVNLSLRSFILPFIENNWIVFFITWSVLILESALFTGIFSPQRIRFFLLQAGLLFHLFIFLVHGLGSFGLAMAGALILYLYPMHKNFSFKTVTSIS